MKRIFPATLVIALAACSPEDDQSESLGETSEALNGDLSSQGFLTRKSNGILPLNEPARRADTDSYYDTVGTDRFGGSAPSIRSSIGTLEDFQTRYEFTSGSEFTASYYNRGDLGLGREMHCKVTSESEAACYVTNFAAGSDGSEFTFGLSRDIAFDNMDAENAVATVAMVYRPLATGNLVIFAVYDASGDLTNTAPLDRHGLNFFNAFAANGNSDPGTAGTPGVEFNNHIPSNCLNCHGGTYSPGAAPQVANAYFLPFDLDQFEFQDVPGKTLDAQQDQFRNLNQLVRGVAGQGGITNHPIYAQIQGWYGNTNLGSLSGNFRPEFVPDGWDDTSEDIVAYRSVVRPSCRACHMASQSFPFNTAASFPAALASNLLESNSMPHALQTQREFWQSGQPVALETWFTQKGETEAANTLRAAGPKNIVTLDPHLIATAIP